MREEPAQEPLIAPVVSLEHPLHAQFALAVLLSGKDPSRTES